jgi:hypothetical protein
MITATDALHTVEFDGYFVILPSTPLWDTGEFTQTFHGKSCEDGFAYASGSNTVWLTVPELRALIREHCDPSFEVDEASEPAVTERVPATDLESADEFYRAVLASG